MLLELDHKHGHPVGFSLHQRSATRVAWIAGRMAGPAGGQIRADVASLQGCEIALHAKTLRIPVVMISGSIESIKFADDNGLQLLCKPFRILQLIHPVEDAIASGQSGQRDA